MSEGGGDRKSETYNKSGKVNLPYPIEGSQTRDSLAARVGISGSTYTQALNETGKAYQTLANYMWVASRYEFSRRQENLSFSHHFEAAAKKRMLAGVTVEDPEVDLPQGNERAPQSRDNVAAKERMSEGGKKGKPGEGKVNLPDLNAPQSRDNVAAKERTIQSGRDYGENHPKQEGRVDLPYPLEGEGKARDNIAEVVYSNRQVPPLRLTVMCP